MNDTNLEILVQLKDEASAGFKKIADSANQSFSLVGGKALSMSTDVTKFSKVLAGAAVAGGAALVAFGISAVKSFSEAQVAMARVDATLKAMGEAAMENKDAILEAADAAVKLGFDDEEAAESITKLYQRTGNLNQAMTLNATAMDLARAKNIELGEATNLVGQVLSGNGRLLKQYGIEISDTLPPLEALKQLQKQVQGQAGEFANTFEGQMQVVSLVMNNFKEQIGGVLVEALMPFIQQFNGWLLNPETQKQFKEWTAEFKSWAEVVIPVVIETFRLWYTWISKIVEVLLKVADTINMIIERAARMASAIGGGIKNFAGNVVGGAKIVGGAIGLADGGLVTRPTLAMIGEGGESEAVIPLSKLNKFGGGGPTVNINGGVYLSEDVARELGDKIISQFTRINKL